MRAAVFQCKFLKLPRISVPAEIRIDSDIAKPSAGGHDPVKQELIVVNPDCSDTLSFQIRTEEFEIVGERTHSAFQPRLPEIGKAAHQQRNQLVKMRKRKFCDELRHCLTDS